MNRKTHIRSLVMVALFIPAISTANTSVDNAHKVCQTFENSNLLSKPCEISGLKSKINITLDMSPSEARKTCTSAVNLFKKNGITFNSGWTLNIYSPYNNKNSIAYCNLPI
ncbi:hypothetical protein [Laribacter hongkongensis]|uniref:hypothetical protein n=1 Tax=Laribacter hongkongensis TaxID=168471 RepID=UPI001EFE50A9|nr:hypothetical protein [Laribacter hongkongensis]MCG9100223.1 hypothetical protein [Laribacter hongkongensis]MCG9115257.1 hypothetical protein [Laribacter hongkongensis]